MEPRRQAPAFLLALLSDVDTRSCWQLAEQAGDASPHAMQRLVGEAVWDADAVRDDVRGCAVDALGDELGDLGGVLILDDTNSIHTIEHWMHWSTWRRRHKAAAKTSDYHRRGDTIHQPAST